MKNLGLLILVFVLLSLSKHKSSCEKYKIKEKLKIPFGTIVKIKAKVIDGDKLSHKAAQGRRLLKVISVNGKKTLNDVMMFYENETYGIPDSIFRVLDKGAGSKFGTVELGNETVEQKVENGKAYHLYVYETGSFVGIPEEHHLYLPTKGGIKYHFSNKLKVLGIIQ